MSKYLKSLLCGIFVFSLFFNQAKAAPDFLPPEKAFLAETSWSVDGSQIVIQFAPVKGYYIYKEALHFQLGREQKKLSVFKPNLPVGIEKFDPTFQKNLQIYKQPFEVFIPLASAANQPIYLEIELQGCAEAGICYPPMTMHFLLTAPGVKVGPLLEDGARPAGVEKSVSLIDLWREREDVHAISDFLEQTSVGYLFLAFLLLGLTLAFTPCVLPMLPIMSSVIFGRQEGKVVSKSRASVLAFAYILGMALLYSLAGVAMAALGGSAQRALQSPLALIMFALLLLGLSGSLFGFYELRLPHSWHQLIDRIAGKQKGGSIVGSFALGGISTLVASPCITAPLAGVLGFIAQTGSMTLGAGLLFVMALGMGLPLFFIAIEARILIPSTGVWMVWLQRALGVLLVFTAIWVAIPLFQGASSKQDGQVTRQLGELHFRLVSSISELDQQLALAKEAKRPVLLDFYADWCISCKEMELNTFSNSEVSKEMQNFVLLQADVTSNTPANKELLKRFGLFGPPAILFFNSDTSELKQKRIVGYMSPEPFTKALAEITEKN
ncbi:protein-disulfide reductase DsbD [Polynucleobacter paneuropaeus]|uniref:protein-disulfide reductase DsbD n=1 Tax=Polynucleobacter paneuropaeus TaxID=2527775 RepID=UPI001BFD5D42|nr:protein-disulfide reductase DsbD [Polynucleobacter paneuropaeus]QWD52689.1 protein-disulfide reductase DsbD [Polynucleobacter paneuropaeus]QWD57602.1 protein-disulfide reductase DsbD [Polynucleobacter paneuropaeus]